jgi:ABC-2 type transport system ATP-binding protein
VEGGVEIKIRRLDKQFGAVHAVRDLTFDVTPGRVTGFLGPNGAGKTTTLRIMLGLVHATGGETLFGGRRYLDLDRPRRVVGAVLEATGFHPGRRGRDHLRMLAGTTGVGRRRVEEVLDQVGLADAGHRRVGGYSLGMRQRLGLASALLGGPAVLILDEPANGLDPEGMAWLRHLMRGLADDGRTILVSSHVLSEMSQVAGDVVIVNRGELRFAGRLEDLGGQGVLVRTGAAERLRELLLARGHAVTTTGPDTLEVRGIGAEEIGRLAIDEHIVLSSLTEASASLEAAFLDLTRSADTAEPAGVR